MKKILFLLFVVFVGKLSAQSFYDINTIQKIEIYFSQSNWDTQLDTAKQGADSYILADSVRINGSKFDSVGVKYKGNSSYNPTYKKNPLHLELNHIKNQSYLGVKDIKLGNNYADPSMIREVLGYSILKNYMHCSQANFARVYINGTYYGVYSNAEAIGKQFYSDHFYSSSGTAIKCNPIVNPSTNTKSNLKYFTTGDSSNYFNYYEVKSTYGWNELRALCDTVTNYQSSIANNLDMDRVIWMLAFNNVVVNLDSYSGAFCQNYYLYKDQTNHFNPTIWDLNMCFGGFPYIGASNSSLSQQSITGMQNLPLTVHASDAYWPLINIVNSNPMYKRMYVAHMRTIANEFFANSQYITDAQNLQALIDTSVVNDTCKFYTYSAFQNGLTTNTSIGSYSVPGISNLMTARNNYLQSTSDFLFSTPVIAFPTSTPALPSLNSYVTILCNTTNASSVYLGYRNSNTLKFTRVPMFDDGMHNDGASGDNVYGADFLMTTTSAQYYIYAENSSAGMFSPQRAEHEYYTVQSSLPLASSGQLKINEFMAVNETGALDEAGQLEDWIELYNTTSSTLNLSGLNLSDALTNLTKYTFPEGTIIAPGSYLIVWADENAPLNSSSLHANFKLSSFGESIYLSNNGSILDSITFGSQLADVSMARCPDGSGNFASSFPSTFNASNCISNSIPSYSINDISIYPNPSSGIFYFTSEVSATIAVYDRIGNQVFYRPTCLTESIDLSILKAGVYFISLTNNYSKRDFKVVIE